MQGKTINYDVAHPTVKIQLNLRRFSVHNTSQSMNGDKINFTETYKTRTTFIKCLQKVGKVLFGQSVLLLCKIVYLDTFT